MAPKQIILLLDGTWNDADVGPFDTNIVRLRELINRSLGESQVDQSPTSFAGSRKFKDEKKRLVYYERGVGTGALWDQISGGAFGVGLSKNVRRAYRYLSW